MKHMGTSAPKDGPQYIWKRKEVSRENLTDEGSVQTAKHEEWKQNFLVSPFVASRHAGVSSQAVAELSVA